MAANRFLMILPATNGPLMTNLLNSFVFILFITMIILIQYYTSIENAISFLTVTIEIINPNYIRMPFLDLDVNLRRLTPNSSLFYIDNYYWWHLWPTWTIWYCLQHSNIYSICQYLFIIYQLFLSFSFWKLFKAYFAVLWNLYETWTEYLCLTSFNNWKS